MEIPLTGFDVTLTIGEDRYVAGHRAAIAPDVADLGEALREALEKPLNYPPLRRALTPDDRVAVVIDERLPQLGVLVSGVIDYLTEAGIDPNAITLVSAAGSQQNWIDDLPDAAQDVRTEIHNPTDRRAVSYLASTREGRRVYLNRTVVEADLSVVLAGCRYDAALGTHDGTGALFPALSDAETLRDTASRTSSSTAGANESPLRQEASEVAWLLGTPFLVQVVEGHGDAVAHVIGGIVESTAEGQKLLEDRWRVRYDRPAEVVVATMAGDPARHDFATMARAAVNAAHVVEPGGRIVLLTHARPKLGEAAQLLLQTDDLDAATRSIRELRTATDQLAAIQWLHAARTATLYLLSDLPDETAEELFTTPLQTARQAQRLVDQAASCLVLADAHKALAVLD